MKTNNKFRSIDFRFKNYKIILAYILTIPAIVSFFSSCEKVVYIDLNSTNPIPVVEANVTNMPGPYTVKLSTTVNYYDSNTFPAITDATVTISDNAGNSEILRQTWAVYIKPPHCREHPEEHTL